LSLPEASPGFIQNLSGSEKGYLGNRPEKTRPDLRLTLKILTYTNSKLKMISRRLGGGDEAYWWTYVEEADDDANEDRALI